MRFLSLIPKGVVIAMQAALVALVLLATVPIATGGLDISDTDVSTEIDGHVMKVDLSAHVRTNLYFDITDLHLDLTFSSGDNSFAVPGAEHIIPKNFDGRMELETEVSLMTGMMMLLCGVSDDPNDSYDVVMTAGVGASTLGGMISVHVDIDIVVAGDIGGTITVGDDKSTMKAEFTVHGSDILDEISAADWLSVSVGDLGCTVSFIKNGEDYDITVDMTSSSGPLADAVDNARNSDGGVTITYGGDTAVLTKEQTDLIVGILKMLCERWSS
ncbi:MAG: hypothetical protein FWG58_01865 [Methanomassiliicoccaceae archaeon]|nr:hypothetical protein [Methanomassiliicoccaceae archaeon]